MVRQGMLALLLGLLLAATAWAEDPGIATAAVLDPSDGRLLAHYSLDELMGEQIKAGQETPHYGRGSSSMIRPGYPLRRN